MKKIFFILLSVQIAFASTAQTLKSGETVNTSVKKTEKKFYKITVPKNKSVRVNVTELQADVDLYVKKGNEVRIRFNDCYSSNSNTENEECLITNEGDSADYTILVYGFEGSSYNLKATIDGAEEIPTLTNEKLQGTVTKGEGKQYKLSGKKGKAITVTLSDLTADADLRVKAGRKAGLRTFDCKSIKGGTNTDECTITPKEDGTVYVHVYGYREASYSLKATEKNNPFPKLEEILDKANQSYQNNKNCESDTMVCADKVANPLNDKLVFVLDKEYEFDGSPLTKTTLYAVTRTSHIKQLYHSNSFSPNPSTLIKLKNTDLIAMKIPDQHHAYNYDIEVYNVSGSKEATLDIHRDYGHIALNEIKTIENGSKLIISYWEEKDNVATIYQDTYDIRDTSNVEAISTHEVYDQKLAKNLAKANSAYQNNKNCESDNIVCIDKRSKLIYVLDNEYEFEEYARPPLQSTLYVVTKENHIRKIQHTGWRKALSSLIKLKDTDLIALNVPNELHSLNYSIKIYNQYSNKVIDMSINRYDGSMGLKEMKTIENGSKLIISYWEEKNNETKSYKNTYDISDISNVKVISSHKPL